MVSGPTLQAVKLFDVYNPSDLSLVGRMLNCSKIETIKAIDVANKAWDEWRKYQERRIFNNKALASK